MIVKCGTREFELDESDEILYNGACYQIITQEYSVGFNKRTPIIAKSRAEKMIREGLLVFKRKKNSYYFGIESDIYKINANKPVNCDECVFINITEQQQTDKRLDHVCLKHDTRVMHRSSNSKITHSQIYPCNLCNGDDFIRRLHTEENNV